jgi:hypothetical protein
MRREIIALLLLAAVVNAALDQSYIHTVSRNGSSVIVKTMELSVFSNELDNEAFGKVDGFCKTNKTIECSVDEDMKTITITERFSPAGYYSFKTDYGVPFTTHKLVLRRIPTDRFGQTLDKLLFAAGVINETGDSVDSLDLKDRESNKESALFLRRFNANITYTLHMPSSPYKAAAGNVTGVISGNSVTFDLVEVIEESESIEVEGNELNISYLAIIAMVIVLAALTLSFMRTKKVKRRRKR